MSGINESWEYFSEERFSGIVMTLGKGDRYFYRAPNGDRFEVMFLARKKMNQSKIRIGIRPVDEEGKPIPKKA